MTTRNGSPRKGLRQALKGKIKALPKADQNQVAKVGRIATE